MKKNSVIKTILFVFLTYVVLSWIIPGGSYSAGEFVKGEPLPTGLSFIFFFPILTLCDGNFAIIGIVLLLIGALYGVMNKTGVYQKLVEGTVKKFNGKEKAFLIISILSFAILASLTNLTLPLIIMVPFFVAVILLLGFNRMTALLSTIGAILVGNMGTIFGYNYINSLLQLKTNQKKRKEHEKTFHPNGLVPLCPCRRRGPGAKEGLHPGRFLFDIQGACDSAGKPRVVSARQERREETRADVVAPVHQQLWLLRSSC